jgi:DeoR/GlpR family transcriptional regulator of sugar metabolism
MLHINNDRKKITTKELAVMMGCSVKTISRHMDENLREEKEMLNNSLL